MTKRALLALALLLTSSPAAATLTQPNGLKIPTPLGCDRNAPVGLAASLACECEQPGVCNIGKVCPDASTCDSGVYGVCETTLWHSFNDNTCIPSNQRGLDPYTEAAVTPETFRPTCPLTFDVVTRGTAMFGNVFGWYNVSGHAPALGDLHVMLSCHDAPGTAVVLDLAHEPAYLGGQIGFFIATPESHTAHSTCANSDCCATVARVGAGEGYLYYSERQYNADNNGPSSFIHLLTLASHIQTRKFYFAWEDIYGGSNGDFTDVVTSVGGVECAGGGEECATGKKGACAVGVTHCAAGSMTCSELLAPSPEVCDGVDNDCNGLVDDGATCPGNQVCDNGRCVPNCQSTHEFDCAATGLRCDDATGRCVDPACVGVTCAAGQVCRHGACGTPCEGVTCPHGQTCLAGACMDLCAGVTCQAGQVCVRGLCMDGCGQCDGIECGASLTCDGATGACKDLSCPGGCAAGTFCEHGTCKDVCDGAVCPSGQICQQGKCQTPGDPLLPAGVPDAGAGGGPAAIDEAGGADTGCGFCARGAGSPGPGKAGVPLMLLGAGGWWVVRRRK